MAVDDRMMQIRRHTAPTVHNQATLLWDVRVMLISSRSALFPVRYVYVAVRSDNIQPPIEESEGMSSRLFRL